jgi:hypothetical protein
MGEFGKYGGWYIDEKTGKPVSYKKERWNFLKRLKNWISQMFP